MGSYLWQNFLIDGKIKTYIARHIEKMYGCWCEALIEIWPGKWAITALIEHISEHFFVIEKDVSLIQQGKLKLNHWIIIQGDVLDIDIHKILWDAQVPEDKTLIVGNLPYYITSPILRKFFGNGEQRYAWWIFMLQDEVGQKLRFDAKKKSYLWRLINYTYQVIYLKWVPAKCFKPIPKVKSCLVELIPHNEFPITNSKGTLEWNNLIDFLHLFAPFSRKTLGAIHTMVNKKSDSPFVIPDHLKKKRLEELSWEDLSIILT